VARARRGRSPEIFSTIAFSTEIGIPAKKEEGRKGCQKIDAANYLGLDLLNGTPAAIGQSNLFFAGIGGR